MQLSRFERFDQTDALTFCSVKSAHSLQSAMPTTRKVGFLKQRACVKIMNSKSHASTEPVHFEQVTSVHDIPRRTLR